MTKVFIQKDKDGLLKSYLVKTDKDEFNIPVFDVRRKGDRVKIEAHEKSFNIQAGSKYLHKSYSVRGKSYN